MKRFYISAVILCSAALMLVSCGQDPGTDPVNPDNGNKKEEVQPVSKTLTFVLPAKSVSGKTAWAAGDQIVVHGEYAKDQVVVTLAAGDISGNKATVKVDGLKPYVRDDVGSSLYASWPATVSSNIKHCFFYTGFVPSTTSAMMAAYDKDDTFQFQDICTALSFSITGDYDSYALTGRKDAVVGYEYYQVKLTDKEQDYDQYHQGPMVTITGKLTSGLQTIYLPGDVDLPNGYDLKFFKDEKAVKAYTVKEETVFARGSLTDLGDITSKVKDFEQEINVADAVSLSDDGTANCYIVTAPGTYKIQALKGNTTDSVGAVETVEVLWETWNNVEEVAAKSLINATAYEGGYVYFRVAEPFHGGNALIAAKDENEVVLWSWHIWMPTTPVTTIVETNVATREMMTRNVGALVDTPADGVAPVESFGLVFQWGRKDPFPGIGKADDNTPATVAGTAITYLNEQISLAGGVENPTVYYYMDDKDWQNQGNDVVSALWGEAKKTVNDPCPPGFCMPARESGPAFWASSDITGKDYVTLTPENYTMKIGQQVFPLAGYIDDADGVHKGAGQYILIWSGRWDSGTQNGYGFSGTVGSDIRRRGTIRSRAGAVRCVKL